MTESTEFPDLKKTELNSSLPLSGECVTFTGTLASMIHRGAAALVETYGGRSVRSVSGAVTMLVVGEEGWPLEEDGEASQKLKQATHLIAEGAEIRVVQESDWLHLIGLNERRDEIQRSYTPAMLSRLLNVPVGIIRRWDRIGLIKPVRRISRLPYFDYREVASAQRLASLLNEGVPAETLERSLTELSATLTGTDRSLAQLTLLVQDNRVVLRDAHGMLNPRTGQRLLDFDIEPQLSIHAESEAIDGASDVADDAVESGANHDEPPIAISFAEARMKLDDRSMQEWTADEWFNEGCRLAEEGAFESAVNAFRNCLSLMATTASMMTGVDAFQAGEEFGLFPDPADVHFHLADSLYRGGKTEGAIERYHCAIESAPDFIEAWTQLGCLLTENEQWGHAEEALLTAIKIHDSNPDALLHYAQLLDQIERGDEALIYWEKYLRFDSRGPWADHARGRLDEAARATQLPPE